MALRTSHEAGFTLVELMVVTIVAAILLAGATATFTSARGRAADGAARSNLRSTLELATTERANGTEVWPNSAALAAVEHSMSFVDASNVSTGPKVISVRGADTFVAAAQSESGTCWVLSADTAGQATWASRNGPCQAAAPSLTGVVTTLAGSGSPGYAEGIGSAAQFFYPDGVAVDAHGNVYVADSANERIRKITPTGVVSTYAGTGVPGYVDGGRLAAMFTTPSGLAFDQNGNLYVADRYNNVIRKIAPDGTVSTVAGDWLGYGWVDGTGTAAQFTYPLSIATDAAGNVYATDLDTPVIRKITPAGVVSTLAGGAVAGYVDGPGSSARFHITTGLAADANGNVYVADYGNHRIRKIAPDGTVSTLAGSGVPGYADGIGTAASFHYPADLVFDGDNTLYVVDAANNRVRSVTLDGNVSTLAGAGVAGWLDGPAGTALFSLPWSIAYDAAGPALYVTDAGSSTVRKIS